MKVLSVRQPWAWLIANGHKDIENRDWSTNHRGPVAIHAGKRLDPEMESIRILCGQRGILLPNHFARGGIVGRVILTDCVSAHPSVWFKGEYGFVLAEAQPLDFIELTGRLGFFDYEFDSEITGLILARFTPKPTAKSPRQKGSTMKRDFMSGYKTHDGPRGSTAQWQAAFNWRMGIDAARAHLKDDSPHDILGVLISATWEEIKRAYRALARQHHPDLGGDAAAFRRVQAAFEILEHNHMKGSL